jgi:serine protease Do
MNNTTLSRFSPSRRRVAFLTGALLAATLSVALVHASTEDKAKEKEKASINLKVDTKSLNRGPMEMGSFSAVAKRVAPSVVKITVETKAKVIDVDDEMMANPFFRQFFGNRQLRQAPQAGLGSGVIISPDGYIVTNNHVVEKADKVSVTLDDGRELKAKVVGTDPQTDVAVIKVEAKDLAAITFASSSDVEVGDRVLAIGNPFGIGETVTSGIVSAKSRRAGMNLAYEDFIQTDAAINPGNSGGALVDIEGRLIGINTAILSRSGGSNGIGLAIPSDMVQSVSNSLVKNGKVVRGYLGVTVQTMSQGVADALKINGRQGALVTDVAPDSPAEKAGLKDGDVILKINDQAVADSSKLSLLVSSIAPKTPLKLVVMRDGKEETINAVTGFQKKGGKPGMETDEGDNSVAENDDTGVLNGVAVADIDRGARRELNIPARVQGAIITRVEEGSAAARAGLQPGDVILEINKKPVKSAEEAVKFSEVSGDKKTLLKLWSRGSTVYTQVDESDESAK